MLFGAMPYGLWIWSIVQTVFWRPIVPKVTTIASFSKKRIDVSLSRVSPLNQHATFTHVHQSLASHAPETLFVIALFDDGLPGQWVAFDDQLDTVAREIGNSIFHGAPLHIDIDALGLDDGAGRGLL